MPFKKEQAFGEEGAQFAWVRSICTHGGLDEGSHFCVDVDISGDGSSIAVE